MTADRKILDKAVERMMSGEGAHAATAEIFSGLDWKLAGARPAGAPHSLFQLLHHMTFWQEWAVEWLQGTTPAIPRHASGSWPGDVAPASQDEWEEAVRRFQRGLADLDRRFREADLLSKEGGKSRLEMAQTLGAHNSYHAGQAVLLRQLLGQWPPPTGGLTW
jgi:uncharacterized damage-inducible protein DinB